MNEETIKVLNIFNDDVLLNNPKNQEKQQVINELLQTIKEEETNNGNREIISINNK